MNDPDLVDALLQDVPELTNSQEIAALLRVETATVAKWIRAGELSGMKIGKRVTRVRKADLREFLLRADEMNLSD
ncbi:helix-turn-helix domain-containing protein [Nesterenkonia sp.]|uniref:helix-turn-helix domain-containing protein n=1 Tax=Nesterenkonia sp. TaxID=704201 RepID=UPI0026031B4B|nr:helix-turn-helix domain-containing protein [Nesterenkonia sp.]